MNKKTETEEKQTKKFIKNWKEKLARYKIHFSVAAAVLVVGASALVHYKNEMVQEELIKALAEYQKSLLLAGGEIKYGSLECSGMLSTDCEIKGIKLSMMGEERLSIKSLRLGSVEEIAALKGFSEGGKVKASIDIEIDELVLPKSLIAEMVTQNVSNAFQQSTLDKLNTLNLVLKAEVEGSPGLIKNLVIDCLKVDNAIMPIKFSMEASDISSGMPDSMIIQKFKLSAEDRAISDVTYESVNSYSAQLGPDDKALFLKEFGLQPSDMSNKAKASRAINNAIAKRFESDLATTSGTAEKELIRAMISVLKGESDEIVLKGKNKNRYTLMQIQNFLLQSSAMSDEESKRFMRDKFLIEVEAD